MRLQENKKTPTTSFSELNIQYKQIQIKNIEPGALVALMREKSRACWNGGQFNKSDVTTWKRAFQTWKRAFQTWKYVHYHPIGF
jgi:hypothetical protein